jgi:hypothetical protein
MANFAFCANSAKLEVVIKATMKQSVNVKSVEGNSEIRAVLVTDTPDRGDGRGTVAHLLSWSTGTLNSHRSETGFVFT